VSTRRDRRAAPARAATFPSSAAAIIPDDDRPALRAAGVAEVFTPGASTHDIVAWVREHLGPHVS
jgi:methylmalonyl-CoA mutase C-terminal domain/subunit